MANELVVIGGSAGGGGGSPAGSDTYVQYNNSGSFGADAGFTYNYTLGQVTISAVAGHTVVVIGEPITNAGIGIHGTAAGANGTYYAPGSVTGLYQNTAGQTMFSLYAGSGLHVGQGYAVIADGTGTGGWDSQGGYVYISPVSINAQMIGGPGLLQANGLQTYYLQVINSPIETEIGSFSSVAGIQMSQSGPIYSWLGPGFIGAFNTSNKAIFLLQNNSQHGYFAVYDGSGSGHLGGAGETFIADGTSPFKTSMLAALVNNLGGGGTQMVTSDNSGNLGVQAIPGGTVPGGTNQDVQINVSGAFGADTGKFVYDYTNHRLGIGRAPTTWDLEIYNLNFVPLIQMLGEWNTAGMTCGINAYSYSVSSSNLGLGITGFAARGTELSPSATQSGDKLLTLHGGGYTNALALSHAAIKFSAASNWSSSSAETYISFHATASGSLVEAEWVRLLGSGHLLINAGSDDGSGACLQVNGSLSLASALAYNYGGTGQTTYTKGDILASTGTGLSKFGVGTDGFALTADSSQSTGLNWTPGFPAAALNGFTTSFSSAVTTATISSQDCAFVASGKIVFVRYRVTLNITVAGNQFYLSLPSTPISSQMTLAGAWPGLGYALFGIINQAGFTASLLSIQGDAQALFPTGTQTFVFTGFYQQT